MSRINLDKYCSLFTVQDRLFLRKGRQLETNKLLKLYFISVFENLFSYTNTERSTMPCRTSKTSYFVCKLNSFNRVLNENVTPVEVLFSQNTTLSSPFVRKRQQLG